MAYFIQLKSQNLPQVAVVRNGKLVGVSGVCWDYSYNSYPEAQAAMMEADRRKHNAEKRKQLRDYPGLCLAHEWQKKWHQRNTPIFFKIAEAEIPPPDPPPQIGEDL